MTKTILFLLTVIAIFTKSLYTLTPLGQNQHKESSTNKLLKLLIRLANSNVGRERRQNDAQQRAKAMFNLLSKSISPEKVKAAIREGQEKLVIVGPDNDYEGEERNAASEYAKVVEKELNTALQAESSALLDKPYVEQKGKNDFLVMRDNVSDPFVTVIPNAIYYDIEKKCVNWLDDCSMDGIRAKLFQAMRSPYK